MNKFSHRSYRKELLDASDIPSPDLYQNLRELEVINRYLGGHRITLQGFKELLEKKKEITVCEIGCGGGDNLKAIYSYCQRNDIQCRLYGIDINAQCLLYAKENLRDMPAEFLQADYKDVQFQTAPDILFSSLFCHHFSNLELAEMLRWMNRNSQTGFFINDLHRHPVAYYSICFLTRFFSKSYLVKNDAPLSVLRGFKKDEWKDLFIAAGFAPTSIQWKWAFRHLIICKK